MSPQQAATFIREQIPAGGLFAGMEWKISPAPFPLGEDLAQEIESLGRALLQFHRATNLLCRKSVEGKQPEWVARIDGSSAATPRVRVNRHRLVILRQNCAVRGGGGARVGGGAGR